MTESREAALPEGERARLRVRYLLEETALFGGVKVALRHAELMAARGHEVLVVSRGSAPGWTSVRAPFAQADDLADPRLPAADVVVPTYWTTLEPASRCAAQVLHLCQGYEGLQTHNRDDHGAIERAYTAPWPAMVVAPHLADMLTERFDRPSVLVPQPLEDFWQPADRDSCQSPPRVLVVGPFEIEWKGVATALRALSSLRGDGVEFHLVRLSQWPLPGAGHDIIQADEVHVALAPESAAELMRSCDLLLAPSQETEGFGLPVLEAMASGVPVVASAISSYRWFAGEAAELVAPDDPAELARAARLPLADAGRWAMQRARGLTAAAHFGDDACAEAAEAALHWALRGGGRA